MLRIGQGIDSHRFTVGKALILGGVKIPFGRGLLGHSDADVLLHAIADSLLGAAGEGDIGVHFPDTDPQYKNMSSLLLLESVVKIIKEKNGKVQNIDATIIAQRPKLLPHILRMEENIAEAVNISSEYVNVKATTTEKMGFTGREEGIAAMAVTLIEFVT